MNLLCQHCKSAPATVHVTDIPKPGGEKRERHLCESCAEEEGITLKQHEPVNEILQKFIQHQAGPAAQALANLACPHCGITFGEFRNRGLLGCPHDYAEFRKHLDPLIERAQGGLTHRGKVPRRLGAATSERVVLVRLEQELKQALAEEEYERAASLRDQIKVLQTQHGN